MAKKWNEASTKIVIDLYTAKLEKEGKAAAAHNDFMDELAVKVEAVSGKAVRAKLTAEKVYVKPDAVASVPKTNTVRKEHFVRAIGHVLGIDVDTIDTLKNGKTDALQAVTDKLGVNDVLEAATTGYSPRPEMVIMNIMQALDVDLDELEAYQCELAEAAASEGESVAETE